MIISNGSRYHIVDNTLCRSIYSLKPDENRVDVYDLQQLSDITTIEPIAVDAARQEKLRSSSLKKSVITGAVAGGAIDFLSPGDSIINGILIGALAGWLFAADKQNPVAHLTLRFSDGLSLPVKLGRDALTQMVAIIENNRQSSQDATGASHTIRPLTPEETRMLRRRRARDKSISVALLTTIVCFVPLSFVFYTADEVIPLSFVTGMREVFAGTGKAIGYSLILGALLGSGAYWTFLRDKIAIR